MPQRRQTTKDPAGVLQTLPLGLLAILPLISGSCGSSGQPVTNGLGQEKTNLVLILLDTTRADHLGAWGYGPNTSPEIDRVAAQGVRFSQYYSSAPWTRPAIASLITGLYPRSTGIFEEEFDALGQDLTTLAERLQAAGYVTLGLTANPNINAWFQFDQGFDEYVDSDAVWKWMPETDKASHGAASLDAEKMTARSLVLIDRHLEKLQGQPFFLQTLYIDPHRPYQAREYGFQGPNAWYDGELRFMDTHMGKLLAGLEQRGLMDETLVIITSDHGEGLDSHPGVPVSSRHGYHLHRSTLHVPLILWHPSLKPQVVDTAASTIDVLPTVLDLLGLDRPMDHPSAPGESFAPLVLGKGPAPEREFLVAETDWRQASKLAVIGQGHSFIRSDDSIDFQSSGKFETKKPLRALLKLPRLQLYSLGAQEYELPGQNNLWSKESELGTQLSQALEMWDQSHAARAPQGRSKQDIFTLGDGSVIPAVEHGSDTRLDSDLEDQLKALGYMGED